MSSLVIRKAERKDIPAIALLFDQYRVFYKQASDIPAALTFLYERFDNNESCLILAELGGTVIGFTQLYPIFSSVGMKRAWLLNDLFVTENARGAGAADALLQAAKEKGIATASRWLLLQTATDNYRAQKVYERNGWNRDENYYSYYLPLSD